MKNTIYTLASVCLGLIGCSGSEPPQEAVRAVKVVRVQFDNFSSDYEFAGEVRARVESRLGFRVAGKITQRQVDLGQHVKAGQVLAQLDPQDYKLAVDASRAQNSAALTNRHVAAADYQRYKSLKEQNFISGAELERREATFKAAQAQLEQAQSQLAIQSHQANYTTLVANVSGVVTAVEAEVGQVVTAGAPVLKIAADGVRDVVFAVPEDKVSAIKPGLPVKLRAWAKNTDLSGKVHEVGASADPVTRTYAVKVALDAGQTPPMLGSTVYVVPQGLGGGGREGTSVIKVPTTALRQEGRGTAVWVLEEASMTVRTQPVQISTADGNDAVIAAGLKPGMLVVTAGVHVLAAGQKVTIYQEKSLKALIYTGQDAIDNVANPSPGASAMLSVPAAVK